MIYPIYAYGHQLLRKKSEDITKDYPELQTIIHNMYETMYSSNGVGLAAPQIGKNIRLIVIDAKAYNEDYPEAASFKKVLINAKILETTGDPWLFNEGCLSVPEIREDISRPQKIKIEYMDENFNEHIEEYDGVIARIMLHEYDHLEGILFVDRVGSLKKTLLKRKLSDISKGNVKVSYKMNFPALKKKR